MDEVLLKQLVRQIKFLNFWITFFGVLILASLVIFGIILFKVVTTAREAVNKVTSFQQTVQQDTNVSKQVCNNDSIKSFLSTTTVCK